MNLLTISMLIITYAHQAFHAYVYGTSFWYIVRGACRIYDPNMVAAWFTPEVPLNRAASSENAPS